MRALVALALVAVVAFLAGAGIVAALGRDGALVALAFFGIVALGGALVAVNDGIARARDRRRPPVVMLSAIQRRQGGRR